MKKKYDVYGMGNALVDIVTEVNDQFLEKYNVEKGLMTLVEEERQFELMNAINLPNADKKCGGSAANTIIAASQFGGNCFYNCKVSNDEMGDFYLKDLKENGVDTNLQEGSREEGITGKCLVMTTPDANRTMNTFLGISTTFSKEQVDASKIKDSSYLYIEGYLITSENGQEAMKYAKKIAEDSGTKVALTFSDPSMVKYFKEPMQQVVGASVDLLFCNEEEAMLFTGESTLNEAREELKKVAKRFAITMGENGATIFDGDTFIDIEPYEVKAVDTNGAGDMFAGAFLYGITNGHSYAEAGKIASLASSKIVSRFGPRLELHEAKEILSHLFEN
ncbi:adenosine kinase [Fulvivirga sediminis]|uniref:Adenosine kinase n=1 Tax=Fulvivirga sediminis TaxID=2803949 RepID=A0A937K1T5_9BACT|nr:adenosine kinase [Fulvivirga sediminis]MBL3657685.1 adenosine kinase [Fulvivirga sediminis]